MFVGIQFEEGDTISLVHENWLTPRKKEVWWPPYKHRDNFVKSLKKGETPDENHWQLYKIGKTFFQEDNFQKAELKIKKAEVTSDVATDVEVLPLKRPRKPNKRLNFDTSSDESDSSEPPNKSHMNRVYDCDASKSKKPRFQSSNNELPPKIQLLIGKEVETAVISEITEDTPDGNVHNSDEKSRTPAGPSHSKKQTPKVDIIPGPSDFERNVLSFLLQIKQQNQKIISLLEDRREESGIKLDPPKDIPVELPIRNFNDLSTIEEYLSADKNISALASYCETFGGRDKVGKVNNILRSLISNRIAANFSFLGSRNDKRSFSELNLRKVVVNAVLSKCEGDARDVDACIKIWLKHAPKRLELEKKKAQKLQG